MIIGRMILAACFSCLAADAPEKGVKGLIQYLLQQEDLAMAREVDETLSLPSYLQSRVASESEEDSFDSRRHAAYLLLAKSDSGEDPDLVGMVWERGETIHNLAVNVYFRVSLEGELEKAAMGSGQTDSKDPMKLEELDLESDQVKRIFKKESDYWLKARHRPKPAAKPEH